MFSLNTSLTFVPVIKPLLKCFNLILISNFRCHRYLRTFAAGLFEDSRPSLQMVNHRIISSSFRIFLSFLTLIDFPVIRSVHNIPIFLEYLYTNLLFSKVMKNSLSTLSSMAQQLHLNHNNVHYHNVPEKYLNQFKMCTH